MSSNMSIGDFPQTYAINSYTNSEYYYNIWNKQNSSNSASWETISIPWTTTTGGSSWVDNTVTISPTYPQIDWELVRQEVQRVLQEMGLVDRERVGINPPMPKSQPKQVSRKPLRKIQLRENAS